MTAELQFATQRACDALLARGWRVVTAESCTGGLVARQLTEIGGSSAWFERGFVTYSNASKVELLGVDPGIVDTHGAVSEPVAHEMATGALKRSHAHVSLSVTGIAGPTGGSEHKPVGTVWFGLAVVGQAKVATVLRQFHGDRSAIRDAAACFALELIADAAEPQVA